MAYTIKQAAQLAIDCQDACNLSGVVASFNKVVSDTLWPEARRIGKGTDWVNQHPIVALFLDKLVDLNGYGRRIEGPAGVWHGPDCAYDQCKKLAEG